MTFDDFVKYYTTEGENSENNLKYLFLEDIRPEDVPPYEKDKEPPKRVIILDI